ncbi:DMT family transporter [Devosia sp.]|uniref:DMT family transporter n=1 Tax=Devosia sp. TaxID=1871048 RepID=UPI003A910D88
MPASPLSDRRVVTLLALFCCLLWGSAVPGVKIGYDLFGILPSDTSSLVLFAGVRFSLAGLLLLALSLLRRRPVGVTPRRLGQLALLGLISTAGQYALFYIGLAHTTGVKVSITTSTSTFFSVLLAHFIYANDRLTTRRALGCVAGFAGVVVVNLATDGLDFTFAFMGEGLIAIAALMFSLGAIYGKRLSADMDPALMTGWQLFFGGLALVGAGLATGGHLGQVDWQSLLLLAYLAMLSAAAFSIWSVLLKHNPVGQVAIFNTAIPIFGVLLSALLLGENVLAWKNLAALILVSMGIWLVNAVRNAPPVAAPRP